MLFDSIVKELGLTKTTIKRLNVGKTKLDKVLSKEKCMKTNWNWLLVWSEHIETTVPKLVKAKEPIGKPILNLVHAINKFVHVCHLCAKKNHIWPKCFKFRCYMKNYVEKLSVSPYLSVTGQNVFGSKLVWKEKSLHNALVAHDSQLAYHDNMWYLDNGCSRHMIGNNFLLVNIEPCESGHVTYGDGRIVKILGKGSVDILNLPLLHDVFYVDGLWANLISISQISDNHIVQFSKSLCRV